MIRILSVSLFLLSSMLFNSPLQAEPTFEDLDSKDVETIVQDFGANFIHSAVSSASSFDKVGFQLGVMGGVTSSKGINDLVDEDFGALPHANLVGILYLPKGLGIEATYLPKFPSNGIDLQNMSAALRWTFSDAFFPGGLLNLQVVAHFSQSKLAFEQTISTVPVNVEFTSASSGADLKACLDIPYLEPYALIGMINIKGSLKSVGTASIFDNTFTTEEKVDKSVSGIRTTIGLKIKLPFSTIAAEYSRVMDNNRMSAKLAFEYGI